MKVYQVLPIIGYGGWGDIEYGAPLKVFTKYEIAKSFLDEYKPGWDKESYKEWAIKEIDIEE